MAALSFANVALFLLSSAILGVNFLIKSHLAFAEWDYPCGEPQPLLSPAILCVNFLTRSDMSFATWNSRCGESEPGQIVVFCAVSFLMSGLPTIAASTILAGIGLRLTEGTDAFEAMLAGAGLRLPERAVVPRATGMKRFFVVKLPFAVTFIGLVMLAEFAWCVMR